MTIRKMLAVFITAILTLGALGAGIGYGLGKYVPGYYRNVFRYGREPGFDPVAVGVGQGLTQGVAGGVVVALVLMALLYWYDTWLPRTPEPPAGRIKPFPWRLILVSGALLAFLGACSTAAFVVGALMGEDGAYRRECGEQGRLIGPVLAADPAFKRVAIDECCCDAGWVLLTGQVESQADLIRLEQRMIRAIGETRGKYAVSCVQVKKTAGEAPVSP